MGRASESTSEHRGAPRAVAALACALLVAACHNRIEDLFGPADAGGSAAQQDAGASPDAGRAGSAPDDILDLYAHRGQACVACLREACAAEARACQQDEACAPEARCVAAAEDPAQRLRCSEGRASLGWLAPPPPHACRAQRCAEACEVGRAFECLGRYAWGRPTGLVQHVTLLVWAFAASFEADPSEIRARLCLASVDGCDGVDPFTLGPPITPLPARLPVPMVALGEAERELGVLPRSYFEIEAPGFEPHLVYPPYDRASDTPVMEAFVNSPEQYQLGFDNFGVSDDPATGFVTVHSADCLLDSPPGLTLEIDPPASAGPDAIVWYGYPPDPALTQTQPVLSAAGYARLKEGLLTLHARRADTGDVVGTVHFVARAGARTIVYILPRSTDDPG